MGRGNGQANAHILNNSSLLDINLIIYIAHSFGHSFCKLLLMSAEIQKPEYIPNEVPLSIAYKLTDLVIDGHLGTIQDMAL